MVDAQLEAAFETESRAVLQLHAKLAPRRRREERELARLARDTARVRADVARLRREHEALRRRYEAGTRRLAAAGAQRWWSWTRLGRPLTVAALAITGALAAVLMLIDQPLVVLASVALFSLAAVLSAPPRRPGVGP